MISKRLWLGCVWTLVAGCGSAADPGRDDDAPGVAQDAGSADSETARDARVAQDAAAVSDSGTKAAGATSWCDVEPITTKNCVPCHKTGGVGPMALQSYADFTRASASFPGSKLYERAGVRIHDAKSPMPSTGMLASADLAVLDSWITAGAPAAPAAGCAATPVQPASELPWPSNCDATYRIVAHAASGPSDPYQVPAGQETHPKIDVDAPWGDEEVQAIAFRPITDNERVLHHWILYGSDRTFLTGWAPGGDGMARIPEDVGMYMPHGAASMYLDMHYFNLEGTSAQPDNSGVEVCVLKKAHFRPKMASVVRNFGSIGGSSLVLAPAGQKNHDATGTCPVTVSEPVHLLTASPHAHTYAVHMKFSVQKKDGRVIVMHDQDFFFHAQKSYALAPEVILETGDTVITTCTYTNDTTQNIKFGESTTSEMCFNFAVYYPKDALKCGGQAGLFDLFF
jgi:Copper type II ascorbate-dependent monooxygenase, C-terminal domain